MRENSRIVGWFSGSGDRLLLEPTQYETTLVDCRWGERPNLRPQLLYKTIAEHSEHPSGLSRTRRPLFCMTIYGQTLECLRPARRKCSLSESFLMRVRIFKSTCSPNTDASDNDSEQSGGVIREPIHISQAPISWTNSGQQAWLIMKDIGQIQFLLRVRRSPLLTCAKRSRLMLSVYAVHHHASASCVRKPTIPELSNGNQFNRDAHLIELAELEEGVRCVKQDTFRVLSRGDY